MACSENSQDAIPGPKMLIPNMIRMCQAGKVGEGRKGRERREQCETVIGYQFVKRGGGEEGGGRRAKAKINKSNIIECRAWG